MEQRMYGLWSSPISPKSLSTSLRLSEPCWDTDGRTLAWVEGRSDRGVLVVQEDGDAPRDLTTDLSVRAFVGYGGGDFTIAHGVAYFVAQHDQRIYRQPLAGGSPRPITPGFGAASTPVVSPDGRWVAYVHTYEDVDAIAIVDSTGTMWPARLATDRDFYMQPCWSGDGASLAWVEWDHPNMPWDGSELRQVALAFPEGGLPVVTSSSVIAGDQDTAIYQPSFAADGSLYWVTDESGRGQIRRRPPDPAFSTRVTDGSGEYGRPAWNHGQRVFAPLPDGKVVASRSEAGFERLVVAGNGAVAPVASVEDYTAVAHPVASPEGTRVAVLASNGVTPLRLVVADLAREGAPAEIRRYADAELVPVGALSQPEPLTWTSFDREKAHGIYYPPASDRFTGSGHPPLVVIVHGGPTSQVVASWNAQAQFLATRGYGVLLPNYRGSTGYGREYMLKLRKSWGIYDVQDAKAGAQHLVAEGRADGTRLVIMGGSAGGFTVLQSLVELPRVYKAGVCLFGVSNMFALASDTHKFEERYLDSLLGPLPEAAALYRERSPLFHAERIVDPVAVFQGEIDRVVPRDQSDSIVASLRSRGVPHEYHVYEGEGHGWRRSETIEKFYTALEAFLRQYVLFG